MAAPKKAAKKKSAKRSVGKRTTTASMQKQSARDAYRGPSSKQIEQSFDKGKSVPLESFRDTIDWS